MYVPYSPFIPPCYSRCIPIIELWGRRVMGELWGRGVMGELCGNWGRGNWGRGNWGRTLNYEHWILFS